MSHTPADAVREFNRFYTARIDALSDGHLGADFSLGETRILYEIAHRDAPTAQQIADALRLDPAYLSRTLRTFKKRGLVTTVAGADRRERLITLTAAGRKAFTPLDRNARRAVDTMLEPLSNEIRGNVVSAMRTIRESLGDSTLAPADIAEPFTLRSHRPGDMGLIVSRHGAIYWREYGYDERFEALVARVVAGFIENLDPKRERCWIAERDGRFLGCIFVVAKTKKLAQLRLLLVEPSARGMGVGRRLVDEVLRFAKRAGYSRVQLWTQSELVSARRIYKAAGFEIVGTEGHESFGKKLDAEVWERAL